ncbi:helix-turn-helix domain-containing protein [Xanthobacter flavus]|uniref:helix-turn-helix domain-containing protein n=1 Tax=Xanthobacter flavus TaxID=281 RepID=UPI0037288762
MSLEASAWAKRQFPGNVSAKATLCAIADYADEHGECWPSRRQLADDTNQSVETISRRLRDLEQAGYIERSERTRENGSRTSDHIRLLMSRAADTPPRQSDEAPLVNLTRPPCQSDEAPLVTADEAPSSLLTRPEPSIEPSEGNIPPNPPMGGVARVSSEEKGKEASGEAETAFDAFIAAYPSDPSHAPHEARRPWSTLTQAERAKAMMALPRYVDHVRATKRLLRSPASYLRSRIWENAELAKPPAPAASAAPRELDAVSRAVAWARSSASRDGWPFVEHGTEAWAAWASAFRHAGAAMAGAAWKLVEEPGGLWVRRFGCRFPTMYPPRPGPEPPGDAAAAE